MILGDSVSKLQTFIPDRLYALANNLFWIIHPRRENAWLIPYNDVWVMAKGKLKFVAPTPRRWWGGHQYWRYSKPKKGDVFIDIGAGIGGTTIPPAGQVGKEGLVIAIEPNPQPLTWLRGNVAINKLENVKIVQKAVWNRKTVLKMDVAYPSIPMIPREKNRKEGKKAEVQADTLDNILSNFDVDRIDFLKMDIEGAEIEALAGAEKTLQITEKAAIAAYHIRDGNRTAPSVANFLRNHGFVTHTSSGGLVYAWKK